MFHNILKNEKILYSDKIFTDMNNRTNKSYININIKNRVYEYEKKIYLSRIEYYQQKFSRNKWNPLNNISDINKDNKYYLLIEMFSYIYNNISDFTTGYFVKINDMILDKIREVIQVIYERRSDLNELFDLLCKIEKKLEICATVK